MKKHYVSRWEYENKIAVHAACGEYVCTLKSFKESTHRKNHVKCKRCQRTKVFRGVK